MRWRQPTMLLIWFGTIKCMGRLHDPREENIFNIVDDARPLANLTVIFNDQTYEP